MLTKFFKTYLGSIWKQKWELLFFFTCVFWLDIALNITIINLEYIGLSTPHIFLTIFSITYICYILWIKFTFYIKNLSYVDVQRLIDQIVIVIFWISLLLLLYEFKIVGTYAYIIIIIACLIIGSP